MTASPIPVLRLAHCLAAAWLMATAGGCADGPVPELRSLNPWVREQWAADEREVTTYHRKVADLALLRAQAARLPPAEAEQVAGQLAARLSEERSAPLRAELVRTLAAFPGEAARQAVQRSLSDEASSVRIAACKGLAQQPSAEGFQALAQTVGNDSDMDVRIAAAHALKQFKEFEAPQALRPALDARDPALQLAAMQSLESLTGRTDYRNSVATWREYLDGGNPTPPPPPTLAEALQQYWNWY
jgi:HEAT repeat protein